MERGRDVAGVIQQYTKFVKPAFDTFVAPSRKHADVIVPWAKWVPPSLLVMMRFVNGISWKCRHEHTLRLALIGGLWGNAQGGHQQSRHRPHHRAHTRQAAAA